MTCWINFHLNSKSEVGLLLNFFDLYHFSFICFKRLCCSLIPSRHLSSPVIIIDARCLKPMTSVPAKVFQRRVLTSVNDAVQLFFSLDLIFWAPCHRMWNRKLMITSTFVILVWSWMTGACIFYTTFLQRLSYNITL